jgi:protein involved in polysaccharide export with SLBB domain
MKKFQISSRRPGTTAETQNNVNAAGKGASVLAKADDDNERLKSLQRIQMQQADRIDTARLRQDPAVRGSDLVGIDLKKIIASPASRYDLILNDGDVIKVPQQLQTIRVSGEVLKPTNIVYESGKGVLSYINESGSFTYNAKKKAVYVQYANGSIKSASGFLFFRTYPRVKPGAEIFVPKKQPREPLGTQAFIAISSTIVSLAVVVVALFRK